MNKFLLLSLFSTALLLQCGGGSKSDPGKYREFCAEVEKCDPQVKAQPNGMELCTKFMAGIEDKYPAKVPDVQACAKAMTCGEMKLMECIIKAGQGTP